MKNLAIETTSEKYLLTQLTSTIKQLAETIKTLMDKSKTLTATNASLTENCGHQKKQDGKYTTGNDYKSKLDTTGYCWTHGY